MAMSAQQLYFLKKRVETAMDIKQKTLHDTWDVILAEFRVNNFKSACRYLINATSNDTNPDHYGAIEAGRAPRMNLIIRKMAALLSTQAPYFTLEERSPNDEAVAAILEQEIDALQYPVSMRDLRTRLILSGLLTGTAVAKTGYGCEYFYDEEAWAEHIPRSAETPEEEDSMPYGMMTETLAVPGKPKVIAVHPKDIFIDPDARVPEEVSQFYHRTWRRVLDIQHDSRMDRRARAQVTVENPDEESKYTYYPWSDDLKQYMRRAQIIEIYDVPSRQFCMISLQPGVTRPLRDWTPYEEEIDCPYRMFQPIPDPESPWGIPYAFSLLGPVNALNSIRAKTVDGIGRGAKTVYLSDASVTPSETVSAINAAEDQSVVAVENNTGNPLGQTFAPMTFNGPHPDLLRLQNVIEGDLAMASCLADPGRNQYRPGDQTATETQVRQAEQGVSITDMQNKWENFLEVVVGDECMILLKHWDATKFIKVMGYDPRLYFWVQLERDRVLKDFTIKIHAGSTVMLDPVTRRRQLIDLMPRILELKNAIDAEQQMLAQSQAPPAPPQPGQPPMPAPPPMQPSVVNSVELLRALLEEFDPRLADRILRRRDPVDILVRLMQQGAKIDPAMVSPQLLQQVMARLQAQPNLMPLQIGQQPQAAIGGQTPNIVPFEARNGIPAQAPMNQFGMPPMDMPGGVSGRALSETMGSNIR